MNLNSSPALVASAALAAGAFLRPKIVQALKALPDYLVRRATARFEADVAAGKIPGPVARLARKLKRAVFEWANEEMPNALGPEKMAAAIDALEKLPGAGRLVAADPDGVKAALQVEFEAMRAEVEKEAQEDKEQPAALPGAAKPPLPAIPPGPPNPPSPPPGQRVG